MRPSENNLYLVHYRTDNLDDIKPEKRTLYAESHDKAIEEVAHDGTDIVVMSVWQRVWSRGDDED